MPNSITTTKTKAIKQEVDAFITENILKILADPVKQAAQDCNMALKQACSNSEIEYHYLKGGNALSLLKPIDTTGDWDFQVIPKTSLYTTWAQSSSINTELTKLNTKVLTILVDSAKKLQTNELANKGNDVKNFIDTQVPNKIVEIVKKYTTKEVTVTYNGNNSRAYSVGPTYQCLSEWALKNCKSYSEKEARLALDDREITKLDTIITKLEELTFSEYCKPAVYVNNSIPAFLLFRLALQYDYVVTLKSDISTKEDMRVKSEIVDISIPRIGNPETYLSVKSEMTILGKNYTDQFTIPGWRYHLFENLLLIGEIDLGISGSPQKEAKRIARVEEAMIQLMKINNITKLDAICTNIELKEREGQTDVGKLSIQPQVIKDFLCESVHYAASISSGGLSDAKDKAKNLLVTHFDNLYDKYNKKSDIGLLMAILPKLNAFALTSITLSEIRAALNTLIAPDPSVKLDPIPTYRLILDPFLSTAYFCGAKFCKKNTDPLSIKGISNANDIKAVENLNYPLGIIKIQVDRKALDNIRNINSTKKVGVLTVKNIVKADNNNVLVSFTKTINSDTKAATTLLHFEYNELLDGEVTNKNKDLLKLWEKLAFPLEEQNGYTIQAYALQQQACADVLLEYLQKTMMIHIRHPIMELYRRFMQLKGSNEQ